MNEAMNLAKRVLARHNDPHEVHLTEELAKSVLTAAQPQDSGKAVPKCPQCGEEATNQDPSGTLWCANAHYWRVAAAQPQGNGKPSYECFCEAVNVYLASEYPMDGAAAAYKHLTGMAPPDTGKIGELMARLEEAKLWEANPYKGQS